MVLDWVQIDMRISIDELTRKLAAMDRDELIVYLRGLDCNFDLDFTESFLASVSIERLQHIALAASLHAREKVVRQ